MSNVECIVSQKLKAAGIDNFLKPTLYLIKSNGNHTECHMIWSKGSFILYKFTTYRELRKHYNFPKGFSFESFLICNNTKYSVSALSMMCTPKIYYVLCKHHSEKYSRIHGTHTIRIFHY